MKRNGHIKHVMALFLSLLMVFSALTPISAVAVELDKNKLGDDVYLTSKTDYTVAPGITEAHITTNNGSGSNQVQAYAIEVDLNNPTTSVIASYRNYDATSWGMQKVRDQAYAAEAKLGVNVVAGVNGDFYNMQTGAPTGTFVMNGVTYVKNDSWNYFAILNDGTPVIGSGYLDTTNVKECVGGPSVILKDGKLTQDAYISGYGIEQLPRTAVGITADKKVVFLVADGRQQPASCGQTFVQLANMLLSMGCVDALSLDGGGSATLISQHEGSDELICRNSPSDGSERTVSSSLLICSSAKPSGVFDHASLTPNNEIYTPGSVVEFSAKGVDSAGMAADLPADGTYALADDSFGTITADGVFTSNGKTGTVVVNYVSGGAVCGNVSVEIVIPDEFHVSSSEISLGFEETTDFNITAKYLNRDVIMKAGDLVFEITDDEGNDLNGVAGTFDGLTFTTLDGVTVNANVKATLAYDSSVTAEIRAIIGAMPVIIEDFEYTTDAEEAANSNGALQYVPSYVMPNYDHDRYPGGHLTQLDEFIEQGYPYYSWPNAAINFSKNAMKTEIVSKSDNEPVRFGEHSMKITFDFSEFNNASNANCYLRQVKFPREAFEGSPTAMGAWIYIPEGIASALQIYLQVANKNFSTSYRAIGATAASDNVNSASTWTGWKYVELDLTDPGNKGSNLGPDNAPFGQYPGNGILWISYQPGNFGALTAAASIYIDNIQLVYGANTDDTENPVISSIRTDDTNIVNGETVLTSNVNTFKASYADFDGKYATGIDFSEVYMYLDGVDVTDKCFINEGDEEIYFYDAELSTGDHSITVSVADKFGNTTEETREFKVTGDSAVTVVKLEEANGAPVLGMDYVLNITTENPSDILAADVAVGIASNFTKYWKDYTVVAGDNYTLDGEAYYNSVNETVNFKVSRNDEADASLDDGIIAKVIFHIPTNVPEGLSVTYKVAKGGLTYASEMSEKFVGSFYGKITTLCESPFAISVDTMIVGSAGSYINVKDSDGNAVSGANIYTDADELIGMTDENGKLFTDKYIGEITAFNIYAEKDGLRSFIYAGQSYPSGGNADGSPAFIKLNAVKDPATTQSITWMSDPVAAQDKTVVLYAEKSAYEADGEAALVEFTGESVIHEMSSSADVKTNYAVRLNSALITGLKPNTDYVYVAGDGEHMSSLRFFSTSLENSSVNFFVIGDTQATDTTNTDEITKNLAASGVKYDFGVQTGDAVDNGGNYTMWANIAKVFGGDFLGSQDLIQVLGNHEYYGDGNAHNAASYFNLPDTAEDGSAPGHYSVQYGNVYVAVVNYGNASTYKEAAKWLVNDAKASNAIWKVLVMHQPTYYTNTAGGNEILKDIMVPAIDEAGINFVFSGHDHSYARTEPLTAGEVDKANGTVYYICGSTGEKVYGVNDDPSHHFDIIYAYNAVYLTVKADDTTFEVTTIDHKEDGTEEIIDSYIMKKDVTCTSSGHAYVYDGQYFTCSVCGYKTTVGTYTGFAKDADTSSTMYFIGGKYVTGWFVLGEDNYYFNDKGIAQTGEVKLDGHTYTFGADGKMTLGAFEKNSDGTYTYYINGEKQRGWFEINDNWYYFSRTNGFKTLKGAKSVNGMTYTFDNDGKLIKGAWNKTAQGTCYYWGPYPVTGLQEIEGTLYYFYPENTYMCTDSVEVDGVVYAFNIDGKFVHNGAHIDRAFDRTVAPTCTEMGYDVYACKDENGNTREDIVYTKAATGHVDKDKDYICDVCGGYSESPLRAIFYKNIKFFTKVIGKVMQIFG